jgi:hypothetical protein
MSEMSELVQFSTSNLYDLDLSLINVLLTQAKLNAESEESVIRACKFVLDRLAKP